MFAFSSTYLSNSLGRQEVWIYFIGLGALTALVGFLQPRFGDDKAAGRSLIADHSERDDDDERAVLLPNTRIAE
jgi:hypothetical protein